MEIGTQLYATLQPDVVVADSAYGTWIWLVRSAMPMPCFGNIMRVTVIFVGQEVGLAIILSSGSVQQCLNP